MSDTEIDLLQDADTVAVLQEYRLREHTWGFAKATCARCQQYPGKPARHHGKIATRVCGNCNYAEVRVTREVAR